SALVSVPCSSPSAPRHPRSLQLRSPYRARRYSPPSDRPSPPQPHPAFSPARSPAPSADPPLPDAETDAHEHRSSPASASYLQDRSPPPQQACPHAPQPQQSGHRPPESHPASQSFLQQHPASAPHAAPLHA